MSFRFPSRDAGNNVDRELEFCFTPTSYWWARHSVERLANESDGCFKKFLKNLIYLIIYILNWNQEPVLEPVLPSISYTWCRREEVTILTIWRSSLLLLQARKNMTNLWFRPRTFDGQTVFRINLTNFGRCQTKERKLTEYPPQLIFIHLHVSRYCIYTYLQSVNKIKWPSRQ